MFRSLGLPDTMLDRNVPKKTCCLAKIDMKIKQGKLVIFLAKLIENQFASLYCDLKTTPLLRSTGLYIIQKNYRHMNVEQTSDQEPDLSNFHPVLTGVSESLGFNVGGTPAY